MLTVELAVLGQDAEDAVVVVPIAADEPVEVNMRGLMCNGGLELLMLDSSLKFSSFD